jgi:hypothetical protein
MFGQGIDSGGGNMPTGWEWVAAKWTVVGGGVAAVNWAALVAWVESKNWVAISLTFGVVVFNVTMGITAGYNHFRTARLKWRKEDEEARKESISRERDEAITRAERAEKRVADLEEDIREMEARNQADHENWHQVRGELNQSVLMQVNDANDLRRTNRELADQVRDLRREMFDIKRSGSGGNNQPAPQVEGPKQ